MKRNAKEKEMMISREEELQQLNEFIEKNGVTKLPKDERGPDFVAISAWGKRKKKVKKSS